MDIKKIIAGTTAVAVIATQALSSMAFAVNTTTNQAWTDAVNFMKTQGLSSTANSVAEYAPMATVKREAASKFFVEFAKKEFGMKPDTTKVCNFSDINEANSVFVPYIIEACQMGILHGVNGKFLPKATLTKLQFLTVLARIVKNDPTIQPANAFNVLKAEGITNADSLSATVRPVSRIELAMLFKRWTEKYAGSTTTTPTDNSNIGDILGGILGGDSNNNTTTTGDTTTTTPATTTGDTTTTTPATTTGADQLVVALDPATPAAQYVPGNGSNIQVLKVDLTAGSKDVTVNTMNVKVAWMIDRAHISNVYVEDADGTIISNQRNFGLDYTALLRLNNGYVVKAGTVVSVYVVVDLTSSTNELFTVGVNEVGASTTSITGLPVVSNEVHTTAYSSETLTFTAQKTSTNNTYYVGDTNKEIAMFRLAANSANNRDLTVKSLRLKVTSTSDLPESRIDNLKLVVNGKTVSTKATIDGRYITFTTDYTIPYGTNRTFYVYADIVGVVKDGDTIRFYLDKTSDISALEVGTNAAASIAGAGSASNMETSTLKEGDNLITKSSASPSSDYISNDATDETVLVANVNVTNPMSVDKFDVWFDAKAQGTIIASQANIDNLKLIDTIKQIRLYINNKVVDTTSTYTWDAVVGKVKVEFNYYGDLKGSNTFKVTVDTANSALDNDYISNVTLKGSSFVDATYVSTNNTVSSTDIKGQAISSVFTVQTPKILSNSRTDGFSAAGETFIAWATNLKVLWTTVQANNVKDLTINTVTATLTYSNVADSAATPVAKLVVDGQVVDTQSVSTVTANPATVTFNGLNIPVTKWGTKEISVQLDTTSNFTAGDTVIPAITSIAYVDTNGNSYTYSTVVNGVTWTAAASANLAMTLNSNSPVEQVVAANPNVETEVARFDFRPTNDDAQIQELLLSNQSNIKEVTKVTFAVNGNTDTDTIAFDGVTVNIAAADNTSAAIAAKVVAAGNTTNYDVSIDPNDNTKVVYTAKTVWNKTDIVASDFTITDGGDGNVVSVSTVTVTTQWDAVVTSADSLVSNVYVYDANGNKLWTASLSNGYVDFNFANAIELPKDKTTTLVVKVQANAINSLSLTNKSVKFNIAKVNGTQKTKVISKANWLEIILANTYYAPANKIYFRKTLLTFANDAQTTTTLSNGPNDIYLWSATADAAGAAKVKEFVLNLSINGSATNATNAYELYINGSKVVSSDVTIVADATDNTATKVTITFNWNYADGYEISAGSTVKFKLVATSVAGAATNDSITVRLDQKAAATDAVNIRNAAGAQGVVHSVVWSDEADKATTTTATVGWFTDADLLSLPLNGETITK